MNKARSLGGVNTIDLLKTQLVEHGWVFHGNDWPARKVVLDATPTASHPEMVVSPYVMDGMACVALAGSIFGEKFEVSFTTRFEDVLPNMRRYYKTFQAVWEEVVN